MRTDPDSQVSGGSGDLHLGWLVPGHRICLGVGQAVRLQFTRKEAEELREKLDWLLAEDEDPSRRRRDYDRCGCASEDFALAMAKGMDAGLDAAQAASQARTRLLDRT